MADNPLQGVYDLLVQATKEGAMAWVHTGSATYGVRVGPWDIEVAPYVPTNRRAREFLIIRTAGQVDHQRVDQQEFPGNTLVDLAMKNLTTTEGMAAEIVARLRNVVSG